MSTISSFYNKEVNLEVFSTTNEIGLKVYVIPIKGIDEVQTDIIVGIGGQDKAYIDRITGKERQIPAGIAHYIEHLMFYEQSKEDIMKKFEIMKSYSNAFTYIDRTVYTVESPVDDYINPLKKLMEMVFVPYFTTKNLLKEKKIVSSEMDIREDSENVISFVEDLDVIGVKENLDKVTPNDLYNIYENYYTPNNMAMVICGDVDISEVFGEIDNMVTKLKLTNKPKVIRKEKEKLNLDTVKIVKSDRKNPKEVQIGLDFSKIAAKGNKSKFNIIQKIFLETNFTKISDFVFELEDEGIIEKENIIEDNLESYYYDKKSLAILSAQTKQHEKLKNKILDHLILSLEKEPNEEDFNITKKALYARTIKSLTEDIILRVEDVFLYDYKIFDELDLLEEITFDEYKRALKKIDKKDLKMYLIYYV